MINKISIITTKTTDSAIFAKIQAHFTKLGDFSVHEISVAQGDFQEKLIQAYLSGFAIVAYCNCAIIIRLLAPYLANKWYASPVMIGVNNGKFYYGLLGAHHGMSEILPQIAKLTNGQIIHELPDDIPTGWQASNLDARKNISDISKAKIISNKIEQYDEYTLHPPIYALGVGLERHVSDQEMRLAIDEFLANSPIHPKSLAVIASVYPKIDEPALTFLSEYLGNIPLRFFTPNECNQVKTPNPSAIVMAEIGAASVCEASALLAAKNNSTLIEQKTIKSRITFAIAQSQDYLLDLAGMARGELHVVGIGPGDAQYRSLSAIHAIGQCDIIVGYELYANLVADLIANKTIITPPLGEERARAQIALDWAEKGHKVALLASGDPGIYALAPLVYEELSLNDNNRVRNAIQVAVHPGISAFQIMAAKLGAPAGNDCALISLSNIMTPENIIKNRLLHCAQGQLTTFLYNPQSKTRQDLLKFAINQFLQYAPKDCKAAIGKHLSRPNEEIIITNLGDFPFEQVDMFSIVMIGNIYTKQITHGNQDYLYAPRGYIEKLPTK